MPYDLSVQKTFQLAGKTFSHQETITKEAMEGVADDIPVAWAGALTTRTDNNTGTITITSEDFVISDGDTVDLFWVGGARRGMTVGTVSGQLVPVDLGSGDNLPDADTEIIVCVVVSKALSIDGREAFAILGGVDFSEYQLTVYGLPVNAGTLTTRTDNNTGEITGEVGHTVTTGDIVNVYWDGGSRLSMTVGTVSGTAIPIDLGAGDNLPIATTPVLVVVVGDAPVEILHIHRQQNQSYEWVSGVSTDENPLDDQFPTSVRMSIADVTSVREARFSVLLDR